MRFPRRGGILAHPTTFPGKFGIGDLGSGAYRFIDFLSSGKLSIWQVLPLGPTGYGDSPYQSFSSFAGNPLLISPEKLVEEGYLNSEAFEELPDFPNDRVDFGAVISFKMELLRRSFAWFQEHGTGDQKAALAEFIEENAYWLDDYVLFMALKDRFQSENGGVWNHWPTGIALRESEALAEWTEKLQHEIHQYQYQQYLFFKQWMALKAYANGKGISIVGDVPIFVAYDSADVWANQELFFLDEKGAPTHVAGVPPDYFSETGQRWGNPLYRWDRMAENGYDWWSLRLKMVFQQVDIVRVDHFRGFEGYWEIPAEEPTAVVGRWAKGPGVSFFQAMRDRLGELAIIAEDLGVITPEVNALRERFEFPGMKILQFAFGGERNSSFLPHNFGRNFVVYTGTHDNETTLGWYRNASESERDHVRRYMSSDGSDIVWDLIRLAFASVADTAVIPLQDVMKLGNEARMNFPGKSGGWWTWRFSGEMLTDEMATRLSELAALYGRVLETESGSS